jgi:hypothetical protein
MIAFFRKIRQGLMKVTPPDQSIRTGRFSKYILYAIGEIVLVVIGILIAVQINDWNEARALQVKVTSIYSIVKSDLKSDIVSIDEVIARMSPKDSILVRIIEGKMTYEDYQNCENCEFVVLGFPDITLNSRGLTLLEENSTIFDIENDSLFIRINEFYSHFNTEISVDMDEIELDYSDNWSYFKSNKSWFPDHISRIKNEDFVQYALTSSDYLNRVTAWHRLYHRNYLGHLKEYKENALHLIEELDTRTK